VQLIRKIIKMKILITGIAGFIGFHVAKKLVEKGYEVFGFDNINDYYDVNLKFSRLQELGLDRHQIEKDVRVKSNIYSNLSFERLSLEDRFKIEQLFKTEKFDIVCHLAAQAGVRYSIENPHSYADSNLIGFLNILEGCRRNYVKHLVYASSSSVYGLNEKMPLSASDSVDHPVSLYAATKKANELMAHSYSHLYNLPTTGLRFFTVYGPWGRPDMSPILFASAIQSNKAIQIFNNGKMMRDFTYIDDIVEGIMNVLFTPAAANTNWDAMCPSTATSKAPYRIYNIGHSTPIELMHFIETIEKAMGKEASKEFLPMQPGDVLKTFADVSELEQNFDYHPSTSIEEGVESFVSWFKNYYTNQ
jgi:UDP-glucuronate 4-epimerase